MQRSLKTTMQTINLKNSLTGKLEQLKTLEAGTIKIYVCGITVYDHCHLGHARTFVAFDNIIRYLKFVGYKVKYVRNITDVDDKIVNKCKQNQTTIAELTAHYIQLMQQDFADLGLLKPDIEPKATEHIAEMLQMIKQLIDNGFAYKTADGDVYFKVDSYSDYGKLSGKKLDELIEGFRIELQSAKADSKDFALWKSTKDSKYSWDSAYGKGRPGWHLECSAMSQKHLGVNFDIHGGGGDLIFPHHENEIAQSVCANPSSSFASFWLHSGAVRIAGDKMSKSLGNFITVQQLLKQYHPEVFRFYIATSHYRSAMSYTADALDKAKLSLDKFYHCLKKAEVTEVIDTVDNSWQQQFCDAMNSDFNTNAALVVLFDLVQTINRSSEQQQKLLLVATMIKLGQVLGIMGDTAQNYFSFGAAIATAEIEKLIADRQQAKADKNYQLADEIRQQLLSNNIVLEDSRDGVKWRKQ